MWGNIKWKIRLQQGHNHVKRSSDAGVYWSNLGFCWDSIEIESL